MAGGNSFGGVTFYQKQQQGTSVLVWPDEAKLVVEQIAGSDDAIIQHLGKLGAQEVSIPIVVEEANWSGLRALVSQSATLSLLGNATRAATLKTLSGRYFAHEGFYDATAVFVG
jgi:hypothetical protein